MTLRRITTAVAVAALASAAIAPTAASASPLGTDSLAAVLTSDGNQFDNDWSDFDIVTEAVLAVLAAKPGSAVGVLADGTTPVTAFVPTDRAFQLLVQDLTGKRMMSEKAIFTTLAGAVGIDGVESVLLYHVVPGATITAKQAKAADGAMLNTALPRASIKVRSYSTSALRVELRDLDKNDRNPYVKTAAADINKGNRQIAHGITRVLRPMDL